MSTTPNAEHTACANCGARIVKDDEGRWTHYGRSRRACRTGAGFATPATGSHGA